MDQDPFEASAVKLQTKRPQGQNGFAEGFGCTDISPRAIGTTISLALSETLPLR